MDVECPSETLVSTCKTISSHNREEHNPNTLCRGNLTSYKKKSVNDSTLFTPRDFSALTVEVGDLLSVRTESSMDCVTL